MTETLAGRIFIRTIIGVFNLVFFFGLAWILSFLKIWEFSTALLYMLIIYVAVNEGDTSELRRMITSAKEEL